MLLASDRQSEHQLDVFSMDCWVLFSLSIFSVNIASERAMLIVKNDGQEGKQDQD